MKNSIQIIGVDSVIGDLNTISKSFSYEDIIPVLKKHAEVFASASRQLSPSNSGRLSRSIKVLPPSKKYGVRVIVGPDFTRDNRGTLTIPALATIMEFGADVRRPNTKKKFAKKNESGAAYRRVMINGQWFTMGAAGGRFNPVPAHPFIRPAFDMNKGRVRDAILKDLKELIKKRGK